MRTIKRAGKFCTSQSEMATVCEKTADELGYEFVRVFKPWKDSYQAEFRSDDLGEFYAVMVAYDSSNPDWPEDVEPVFSHGQMLSNGHTVTKEEWFDTLEQGEA